EVGEVLFSKLNLHIAAIGDLQRPLHRFGAIVEPLLYLLRRFNVQLVGFHLETVIFIDRFSGLDAEQYIVGVKIVALAVVAIVGGNHGNRQVFRQFNQEPVYFLLLGLFIVL